MIHNGLDKLSDPEVRLPVGPNTATHVLPTNTRCAHGKRDSRVQNIFHDVVEGVNRKICAFFASSIHLEEILTALASGLVSTQNRASRSSSSSRTCTSRSRSRPRARRPFPRPAFSCVRSASFEDLAALRPSVHPLSLCTGTLRPTPSSSAPPGSSSGSRRAPPRPSSGCARTPPPPLSAPVTRLMNGVA